MVGIHCVIPMTTIIFELEVWSFCKEPGEAVYYRKDSLTVVGFEDRLAARKQEDVTARCELGAVKS